MHFRYSIAFIAMLGAIAPAAAEKGCKGGDKSQWKSPGEAKQAAMALNYTQIAKVIIEDGCYEVVTINAENKIVGVQFDPVTLELYKVEDPR
jgi:hypothetical protein